MQLSNPNSLSDSAEEIVALKPPVSAGALSHRDLKQGEFWRTIPAYREVDEATFLSHLWQGKNSITTPEKLLETIQDLVPASFIEDARAGFALAPMSVRISPYMIANIDWEHPFSDPIRTQFLPLASTHLPDHPRLTLDSLAEQDDAPVPGLTHRYPDKALFLPLDICPVYCRFCTRSYAVGMNTHEVEKVQLAPNSARWALAFKYIASRPELEDIVVSGGDTYQLAAKNIRMIGETLLAIPHVRRIRFATKGPAVMPSKILTDTEWTDALCHVVELGRKMGKEVVLHTHFAHPNEITWITEKAMSLLFERGVFVRNQSVLQRGVNDDPEVMTKLVKRLGHLHVHPYYVYLHDMVKGVEDLRTTLASAVHVEKMVRGNTAGFNTPTFVCDAPGGGGKRDLHSYEYYDRDNGIAVYTAPSVKPGQHFLYFDPIDQLAPEAQIRWQHAATVEAMIRDARAKAGV